MIMGSTSGRESDLHLPGGYAHYAGLTNRISVRVATVGAPAIRDRGRQAHPCDQTPGGDDWDRLGDSWTGTTWKRSGTT